MLKVLGLLFAIVLFVSARVSYEGYKVYRVFANNEEHNKILKPLEDNPNFDFWTKLNRAYQPVSIIVAPVGQQYFTNLLDNNNISYKVAIENLESVIETERQYHLAQPKLSRGISLDRYNTNDEINAYLQELAENYPKLVTLKSAGLSYEGRELNYIKISNNTNTTYENLNPAIFVDAGIHAREWISSSVALYIINQLVENATNVNLSATTDWYILPQINPDGYNYTWTGDRLWRKTMSPQEEGCLGVDANRNFDFHWNEAGASNYSCDEIFSGPEAFSENETIALGNAIMHAVGNQTIGLYLTLHSYGPYILWPWGYDDNSPAENSEELDNLGRSVANAIREFSGSDYIVGNSGSILYPASGASDDWSKGVAKISLSYTMELNSYDYGFEVPPENISSIALETFEAMRVFQRYIEEKYAPWHGSA